MDRRAPSSRQPFQTGSNPFEGLLAFLVGTAFAVGLFVVMALSQMLGEVRPADYAIEESAIQFHVPEVEEETIEEVEEATVEPDEAPLEMASEPPQLSLDQLDIALNPGTGGSVVGDFSIAQLAVPRAGPDDLDTEEFVDFADLDRVPRPIGVMGMNFPRRLRKDKVSGRIVVLLMLDERGEVLDVSIEASTLPHFDDFVLSEVRSWHFTPPTKDGRPVKAKARLPIPIRIG